MCLAYRKQGLWGPLLRRRSRHACLITGQKRAAHSFDRRCGVWVCGCWGAPSGWGSTFVCQAPVEYTEEPGSGAVGPAAPPLPARRLFQP
ncbi:hypothetical protein GCM10009730_62200 [Streptomyces albidochromogenes]